MTVKVKEKSTEWLPDFTPRTDLVKMAASAQADMSGNKRLRELARAAYDVSFLTVLPCPPLLIADLGRPERFHHMLRVFKPMSPMNLGAWTLTGFSIPLTVIAALR